MDAMRHSRRVHIGNALTCGTGTTRSHGPDLEPANLVAISVDIPDAVMIESVDVAQLPPAWRTFPPPPSLTTIGERWVHASQTPALSVPSAVISHERNFILNPRQREFARLSVSEPEPFSFDPRLWKK
jgi:RES domain-containing protein